MVSSARVAISSRPHTAHFRAHERRFVRLQASLWHVGGVEQVPVQVLNIGLGGAGVACLAPLRPEDRVMLSMLSPGLPDPILLPARVAWVRGRQPVGVASAGLCFEIPIEVRSLPSFS